MKTVGLPISHKENEKRRTLVPNDIQYIKHPEKIFIEDGYGDVLGYSNNDYSRQISLLQVFFSSFRMCYFFGSCGLNAAGQSFLFLPVPAEEEIFDLLQKEP